MRPRSTIGYPAEMLAGQLAEANLPAETRYGPAYRKGKHGVKIPSQWGRRCP